MLMKKFVPDADRNVVGLINNYDQLTTEEINAHTDTYIDTNPHQYQNNIKMYQCIMNTLTK